MMFDENGDDDGGNDFPSRNRTKTEALLENALVEWDKRGAQIGDTIPAIWLYEILGVFHPSKANSFEAAERARKRFMSLFYGDGFRNYLLENRKRWLETNWAEGYEVLDPAKQTDLAQKRRRCEINKALRDESFLLENVDMGRLSAKERQENGDAIARNAALARIVHAKKPGFSKK